MFLLKHMLKIAKAKCDTAENSFYFHVRQMLYA